MSDEGKTSANAMASDGPMSVERVRAEMKDTLLKAAELAGGQKTIGVLCVVMLENGDAAEFSDTRLANLYMTVGTLEAVKARYLQPRQVTRGE